MAIMNFPKFVLILHLVGMAVAEPCEQKMNILATDRGVLVDNLSACATSAIMINGEKITVPPLARTRRSLSHRSRRSTISAPDSIEGRSDDLTALQETGKILQTAAMLPAETLELLRKLSVPLLNRTLALPANLLEGAAAMTLGKGDHGTKIEARTSNNHLLQILASLKIHPLHHLILHKDINLGPLVIKKVLEIGIPEKVATTPPPADVPVTTAPPAVVVPVTEAPPPVVVVPVTEAPPPVAVVPVTEAPPPAVIVPATAPPPVAVVPEPVIPAPAVPVTAAPATVVAVVEKPPVAVPIVAAPSPPKCTNQIAVVQNSPSEAQNAEKTM